MFETFYICVDKYNIPNEIYPRDKKLTLFSNNVLKALIYFG